MPVVRPYKTTEPEFWALHTWSRSERFNRDDWMRESEMFHHFALILPDGPRHQTARFLADLAEARARLLDDEADAAWRARKAA